MSQPPYGPQYGTPVDPYQNQPGQSGYEPSWGGGYPSYGGYENQQQPGYGQEQPQYTQDQPQYYQQPQPQYVPPPPPQPGYGGPGYPIGPGYAPAPQPSRGGRGGLIALVIILALVLVGGGIGAAVWFTRSSDKPSANGAGGSGASTNPSGAPTPTPTAAATHTGDLRTFLIDPPSGSKNWPKPLGTDRNLSLDQASELSSDPKARKDMLNQYSFTKGAVQCWIASGGTSVVDVRLYQFDSTDHADSFFHDNLDATGQGYPAAQTHDVAGVPGAKSYADPKKDDQGFVSVIAIGLKGDVVFVVSIGEKADTVDLKLPDQLMQQQLAKL